MSSVWIARRQRRRRRNRMIIVERRRLRDASNPLDIPEHEFIRRYRITQEIFLDLCDIINQNFTQQSRRSRAIPLELRILAAISFLATGSYQRITANDAVVNMSQPSMSISLKLIVNTLNKIMHNYIKFPSTVGERNQVKQGFYRKFQFPGVIGCIDGSHIAIIAPRSDLSEANYFNRKGFHSINAGLICDSDLKILAICSKFGGVAHDSHVWRAWSLREYIESLSQSGEQGWLIGDTGYPQRPWLMIPILHADEDTSENYYTRRHILVRNCIERCIGLLKARWRCLLRHRVLHYDPDIFGQIINSCAVLHNICISARLPEPEDAYEETSQINFTVDHQIHAPGENERNVLVNLLWQNRSVRQ